jgi:hypothetical protein
MRSIYFQGLLTLVGVARFSRKQKTSETGAKAGDWHQHRGVCSREYELGELPFGGNGFEVDPMEGPAEMERGEE